MKKRQRLKRNKEGLNIKSIITFIDYINKYVRIFIGILAGLMTLAILFQVFSRFILPFSVTWTEEFARYSMIYIVFLGAAIALRNQDLIAVEFLSEKLTKNARSTLKVIINLISIIFFVLLLIKGIELIERVGTQFSPALKLPMSIPYASIPIGAALLIINAIAVIMETYLKKGVEK